MNIMFVHSTVLRKTNKDDEDSSTSCVQYKYLIPGINSSMKTNVKRNTYGMACLRVIDLGYPRLFGPRKNLL
jgi:hypothetical protein